MEESKWYQHEEMCCQLSDGPPSMCKSCNKLKRKFPHDSQLVREDAEDNTRFCVECKKWRTKRCMKKNTQYIDEVDNICTSCFQNNYKQLLVKKKHVKQPSIRVIRWGVNGQERRCARSKHWVFVTNMQEDVGFIDQVGQNCKTCVSTLGKRKLNKSQRKYLFGGRKVKKPEMEAAKARLLSLIKS